MRELRAAGIVVGLLLLVAGIAVPVRPGGFPIVSVLGALTALVLLVWQIAERRQAAHPVSAPGDRPTIDEILRSHDGPIAHDRPTGPKPIGFTDAGEPVYPIVGYTPDGRPVAADKIHSTAPSGAHPRINPLAVTAIVLAVTVPPLAILFGHAALREVRRTGERGDCLAIAGLVFGYISLIPIAVLLTSLAMYR